MLNSNFNSPKHARSSHLWNRLERPLTALLLTLGLTIAASHVSNAVESEPLPDASSDAIAPVDTTSKTTFEDGVYLYGQSQEPDQIGSEYLVFEVHDQQIIGAFYMPYSSFDCFYGTVEANQLALTIDPAYEEAEYSYAVPLNESSAVASTDPQDVIPVGLEGYTRLAQVSENDQRILGACQANHDQF